jgi:hypothetical protein
MGVLVEGLERDRIMIFSRSFACIMKLNQVSWYEGLVCDRMGIIVLSASRYCEELCGLETTRLTSAKG